MFLANSVLVFIQSRGLIWSSFCEGGGQQHQNNCSTPRKHTSWNTLWWATLNDLPLNHDCSWKGGATAQHRVSGFFYWRQLVGIILGNWCTELINLTVIDLRLSHSLLAARSLIHRSTRDRRWIARYIQIRLSACLHHATPNFDFCK